MTPNTTPAPMTDEEARHLAYRLGLIQPFAFDRDAIDEARGALARLSDAAESERTRADALAARISELEAGIGRLAAEWEAKALTSRAVRDRALMLRATELRSLIGHKEGRDASPDRL